MSKFKEERDKIADEFETLIIGRVAPQAKNDFKRGWDACLESVVRELVAVCERQMASDDVCENPLTSPTDLKSRLMAAVISTRERDYLIGSSSVNENKLINALIDTVVEQSEAIDKLLNKVNVVTASHRHEASVSETSLTELSNRQIETEETLTATQARLKKWVGE